MTDPLAGDPRSNRERMLAGDPYMGEDAELETGRRRAGRLAAEFGEVAPRDPEAGRLILATLLGALDEGATVRAPIYVDYGEHLTIGPRTFVNFGLVALDCAPIAIGADCQLGPGVQLLTAYHPTEPVARRSRIEATAPITIEDNVWVGGGAIVLPGVTIGRDTVVGAGAVVTEDLPAGVVAVGNPARVLRHV